MGDKTPVSEFPKAWEKLSSKFILDSLHEAKQAEVSPPAEEKAPTRELVAAATDTEAACGSSAEAPRLSEVPPEVQTEAVPYQLIALPAEKKYFRIGEVSDLLKVEPHVLRYWESEFSVIRPVKSKSGHRVYTRRDVEALHRIRHLLHVEKYSVKGAKKKLSEKKREAAVVTASAPRNDVLLRGLADELKELVQFVRGHSGV